MNKNKTMTISDFYCIECSSRGIPIMRMAGKEREAGHLKKLYCVKCQKETNHVEIRPFGKYTYQDFLLEFKTGRFVNGQRVPISELKGCKNLECNYNMYGKCWNAKEDYNCLERARHKKGNIYLYE
jgi:hypothetical protein